MCVQQSLWNFYYIVFHFLHGAVNSWNQLKHQESTGQWGRGISKAPSWQHELHTCRIRNVLKIGKLYLPVGGLDTLNLLLLLLLWTLYSELKVNMISRKKTKEKELNKAHNTLTSATPAVQSAAMYCELCAILSFRPSFLCNFQPWLIVDSPSCVYVIQVTATNSEAGALPGNQLQCTPTFHCPHCPHCPTVLSLRCRLHAAPQQGQLAVAAWLFQMKFCGFSGLELCALRCALRLLALNVAHFSHGARQNTTTTRAMYCSLSLSLAANLCPLWL